MDSEHSDNEEIFNGEAENDEEFQKPMDKSSQNYLNPVTDRNSKQNEFIRLDSYITSNTAHRDEKDIIIEKLKEGNRKLREKLEEVVERTTTKLKSESLQHSKLKQQFEEYEKEFRRKSKELKTAHQQLENARKDIRTLTYKIEVSNNEDIFNKLNARNAELK